jgi:hypothetical protein
MAVDQPFPMGTIKGAAGPGKNEVSVLFIASYVLASSRRGSAPEPYKPLRSLAYPA